MARIILTTCSVFCIINACTFPLIWILTQVQPRVEITFLYQFKNNITSWLIFCIVLLVLTGLILSHLLRQIIDMAEAQKFLDKDVNQNGKWLFLLAFLLVISEVVHGLFGHLPRPVDFVQGSLLVYGNKSSPGALVTANVAYNLMWNQCRLLSGMITVITSFSGFAMRSYIKILNFL